MGQLYSSPFCPRLPREIIDMIIDFLHHDIRSLLACALVSRAWLPSSRLHLFRTCTVKKPNQFEVAFRTITTNMDVGTHVRQLTIGGQEIHDFLFSELKALLCCLPRLRRLTLREVTLGQSSGAGHICPRYSHTVSYPNTVTLPQDARRQSAPFALEELQLLECDATTSNYARLFRLLSLFSSIRTLFLASHETARRRRDYTYWGGRLPSWVLNPVGVAVQHLHTFDIPLPIIETLLTTLSPAKALNTFWYDDNVLDGNETLGWGLAVDKFSSMMASLGPSHQHLQCLILGPLPILEDPHWIERGGLEQLQLNRIPGLRAFHLRARRLEPHVAAIFAGLPATVLEARFVVAVIDGSADAANANSFREFALAFSHELNRRTQMTFVLDLGVAKRNLPEREFGVLKDRAEEGLLELAVQGRLLIDDSPKER